MSLTRFGSAFLISLGAAYALAVAAHAQPTPAGTSPADAKAFLARVDADILTLGNAASRAGWIQSTYITPDTEAMSAQATGAFVNATTAFAKDAARFQNTQVSGVERRQLELLRTSLTMAAPADPKAAEELSRIAAAMEGAYGRAKYCPPGKTGEACLDVEAITKILAESRDPKQLEEAWMGWHTIGDGHQAGLREVRRALEPGRAHARLRRHRRDVARQVRHAARRLREGARSTVGPAPAAVHLASYLRARAASREVRSRRT